VVAEVQAVEVEEVQLPLVLLLVLVLLVVLLEQVHGWHRGRHNKAV
jgi:hypothetical protein